MKRTNSQEGEVVVVRGISVTEIVETSNSIREEHQVEGASDANPTRTTKDETMAISLGCQQEIRKVFTKIDKI